MGAAEGLPDDGEAKNAAAEGADDARARYRFSCDDERRGFAVSDLVWGKVKSHPWWPGQIFDPALASEMASRHHRRGNFLVAYFGDKTFAWCDASQLKHLPLEFPAMEKQSGSEAFAEAVGCALVEVSRRVELGLACGCVPEEVRSRLKFRRIENAGIREGVDLSAMDWTFGPGLFRPGEFLGYVRSLAASPVCGTDGFGLTVARAQLLAYYRSKGFMSLPDIFFGKGLVEESSEMRPSVDVSEQSTSASVADEKLSALCLKKAHQKGGLSSPLKRKRVAEESRKSRRLSELMEYSEESNLVSGWGMDSHGNVPTTPSVIEDSDKGKKRKLDQAGNGETKSSLQVPARSFKVGECIRRVASKLTSSPSFKSNGGAQKCKERDDHENDSPFSLDDTVQSQEGLHDMDASILTGSSVGELLCNLSIAARDPMKVTDFSATLIGFFTGFLRFRVPNSVNSVYSTDEKINEQRQTFGSVSGEDTEKPEGSRRKRKHILLSVPDGDTAPSEEVKRKRGRPRLSSEGDVKQTREIQRRSGRMRLSLTEERKSPEEVPRKRGRPRLSSTEQNKPSDEVPRRRGRPRVKSATDISPGESVEHKQSKSQTGSPVNVSMPEVVKRKRGRPPNSSKVLAKASGTSTDLGDRTISEMDLSNTTPAYMIDSYWTDVVICNSKEKKPPTPGEKKRGRKRKQFLISSPDCADKTAGEVIESQSLAVVAETPKQMQLPSLSPSNSGGLVPERRISYFGDKCIEESNPTAFILNFMDANSLPSETELVRTFSRYGPLKDAETEIQRPLSFAKVVFKRRADAEAAFLNARRYNFFGHSLLSFRLRSFPSVHEYPINSNAEDKANETVVSSSSFSLSGHKSGEALMDYCIQKAEVSEREEVLLDHTIAVSEGRINGDVVQSHMDVLDAERGKTFVDGTYLDGNQIAVGQGDLDVADRKECSISVNASPADEQRLEADKKPVGDSDFGCTDGQGKEEAPKGEVRLEDQSNERDALSIMGSDNVLSEREEYLPSGADFCVDIQGAERVEASVDCGNIESHTVAGVEILECDGTGKEDPAVDVDDKSQGSNSSFGVLHGAETETLREIDNVAVRDVTSIDSLVGDAKSAVISDAKSAVPSTERLVVGHDDLGVERIEHQTGLDTGSMIRQDNKEQDLKVEAGNLEVLCNIGGGAPQASKMSKCPDSDIMGVSESLEMSPRQENHKILEVKEESSALDMQGEGCHGKNTIETSVICPIDDPQHDRELKSFTVKINMPAHGDTKEPAALDMQGGEGCQEKDIDEMPMNCDAVDFSGTDGKGMIFTSALVDTGSEANETSVDTFCLEFRGTSGSHMHGDRSNADFLVKDGLITEGRTTERPCISKTTVSDNINVSPMDKVNSDLCRRDSKINEAEVLVAPEMHMEGSVITDYVPIKGMVDSSGIHAYECSGATNFDISSMSTEYLGVQVIGEKMGLSDARISDATDGENPRCEEHIDYSVIKIGIPPGSGLVAGVVNVGDVTDSSNTDDFDLVTDGGAFAGGCVKKNIKIDNTEESVRKGDLFHASTRNIGSEVIEMTNNRNLKNKNNSAGTLVDCDSRSEVLVKEVVGNLDEKPDDLADSVNVKAPYFIGDGITVSCGHSETSVSNSNYVRVNGQEYCILGSNVADASCTLVSDKIDVAPQYDKLLEDSVCHINTEDMPEDAAHIGVNNVIDPAMLKACDFGLLSVSIPSDMEVLFCKKDGEHGNGTELERAMATEMAGKSDTCVNRSGLVSAPDSLDKKIVHKEGGNLDIINQRIDSTDADNVEHRHGGLLQFPACGTSDADLDCGMMKLDYSGDGIRETANSEVLK